MAPLLQSVFLAVPVLAYASQQDQADKASCLAGAPADEEVEEACALQSQVVKRHAFAASQKAFVINDQGSNDCPSGAMPLTSSECREAAAHYGYSFVTEGNWSTDPRACYVFDNRLVYFNANAVGSANDRMAPICGTMSAPTPALEGSDSNGRPAKPCCKALTAECLACAAHQTEEEYCAQHAETTGCAVLHGKPVPYLVQLKSTTATTTLLSYTHCCRGNTSSCLACLADQTEEEHCADHPATKGCPGEPCCKEQIAACLACATYMTVEEFCAMAPYAAGCP